MAVVRVAILTTPGTGYTSKATSYTKGKNSYLIIAYFALWYRLFHRMAGLSITFFKSAKLTIMKWTVRYSPLIAFMFVLPLALQAQTFEWARSMGGSGFDESYSIAVDASGNVYTTGSFQGTADFDPGPGTFNLTSAGSSDIYISKLDASGNFVWAKRMGGSSNAWGYSIAVDATGNVYTTGSFSGTADFDPGTGTFHLTSSGGTDIFISKLDTSGNFVWAKSMGWGSNASSYSISVTASGNVYTTGQFQGTGDFDPGPGTFNLTSAGIDDIFISKLDTSGNFVWAKSMGGSSPDFGRSIAVDASGNVYTTGYFYGTCDFDPGPGTFNLTSVGGTDIFISKLDSSGNFVWAKSMGSIGGSSHDQGHSIAVDASGNVYTTGLFQGTVDFDPGPGTFNLTSAGGFDVFISKLDASGNFVLAKRLGGSGSTGGWSIAVDAFGNIFTTGYFEGTADFDPGPGTFHLTSAGNNDIFISKLDASGNFAWAKSMGGTVSDQGRSITVDASGNNVYTSGRFQGTADFDPGHGIYNLTSSGGFDIFIHKMSQCTPPALSTSSTPPLCPGGTGSALVSATGGTGPYTYMWSNSQTTPAIIGVPVGTYTVTVTDSSSCAAIASVTITGPPAIFAGAAVAHPPCYGSMGAISLSPVNGIAPYTFIWSTGATIAAVSGMVPGMYSVTITDSAGCTAVDSFTVNTAPPALDVSTSVSMPQCYGGDGAVVVSVSGGVAPYAYLWSTGASTSILGSIPAGTYSLTVTDKNSCSDTTMVSIPQPPALVAALAATASRPAPNCDGTATTTASGGAPPYAYAWSNGATGENTSGLCAGMYEVTITDSRGCSKVDSVSVALHTGMADHAAPGAIKVYPNPSDGHFVLEAAGVPVRAVHIYNAIGERVLSLTPGASPSSVHVVHLDLSSQEAGIYLLVVEAEGHPWHTERLVIGK